MINVLVVDDDMLLRLVVMTSISLTIEDCRVLQAANGREAIHILDSEHVRCALTDLSMPEMDGFQLIENINTHHPGIPVMAMSGDDGSGTRKRLQGLGVSQFLEKPFSLKDLQKMIIELPEIRKSEAAFSFTLI